MKSTDVLALLAALTPDRALLEAWDAKMRAYFFAQEDGTIMIGSGAAHCVDNDILSYWWEVIP